MNAEERRSLRLEEARAIAAQRGGRLISEKVPTTHSKVLWECVQGHRWEAPLSSIKAGRWCRKCAGTAPVTIDEMQQIAEKRGGRCLSAVYVNCDTPLRWKCSAGHEWETTSTIIYRHWCPICAHSKKLDLKELRQIARRRGGRLLSTHYVNGQTPLRWRCAKGHVWKARASLVKGRGYGFGTWCPKCTYRGRRGWKRVSLEDVQALARARGGECLSDRYVPRVKLKWRCGKGHEWAAVWGSVQQGSWCPACAGTQKLTLAQLHETAASRGGKLVSTEYINQVAPVIWECADGHQWKAAPNAVRMGTWCPECARRVPLTLEEMQSLAASRGGKCLSKKYVDLQTPLRWRCAQGHVWKARPNNVKPVGYDKRGQWCPVCARASPLRLEDMRELARARGGECLSKRYENSYTPIAWRCAKGHVWRAKAGQVRSGSWCPTCAHSPKYNIQDMRELARTRGGECLSKKYTGIVMHLRWRCAHGHVWRAVPANVRNGTWCPVCARIALRGPRLERHVGDEDTPSHVSEREQGIGRKGVDGKAMLDA